VYVAPAMLLVHGVGSTCSPPFAVVTGFLESGMFDTEVAFLVFICTALSVYRDNARDGADMTFNILVVGAANVCRSPLCCRHPDGPARDGWPVPPRQCLRLCHAAHPRTFTLREAAEMGSLLTAPGAGVRRTSAPGARSCRS
jgi:hypothetical protein